LAAGAQAAGAHVFGSQVEAQHVLTFLQRHFLTLQQVFGAQVVAGAHALGAQGAGAQAFGAQVVAGTHALGAQVAGAQVFGSQVFGLHVRTFLHRSLQHFSLQHFSLQQVAGAHVLGAQVAGAHALGAHVDGAQVLHRRPASAVRAIPNTATNAATPIRVLRLIPVSSN